MPTPRQEPFPRVELHSEILCMRCGAPTPGSATCELCFEAIGELRGLAADSGLPTPAPVSHPVVTRSLVGQDTRRHRS